MIHLREAPDPCEPGAVNVEQHQATLTVVALGTTKSSAVHTEAIVPMDRNACAARHFGELTINWTQSLGSELCFPRPVAIRLDSHL